MASCPECIIRGTLTLLVSPPLKFVPVLGVGFEALALDGVIYVRKRRCLQQLRFPRSDGRQTTAAARPDVDDPCRGQARRGQRGFSLLVGQMLSMFWH